MRLIDADAMEKHIMESKVFNQHFKELVQSLIWGEDTIEVEPVKHGKWENKHQTFTVDNMTLTGTYPTCGLCDFAEIVPVSALKDKNMEIGMAKNTNYCPNCGAKMDKESESNA